MKKKYIVFIFILLPLIIVCTDITPPSNIKKATQANINEIFNQFETTWPGRFRIDFMAKLLKEYNVWIYVSLDAQGMGEKILGVCVESYNEKNKWIHIAWLLTNPKGQGVGGKLLNHLDELYLQTAQTLHTNVNGRAKNLYQRHGFVILKEINNYYGQGQNGIFMGKNIPPSNIPSPGSEPTPPNTTPSEENNLSILIWISVSSSIVVVLFGLMLFFLCKYSAKNHTQKSLEKTEEVDTDTLNL